MATKASNQTNPMEKTEMAIEEMDFDALLKEEAELKARSEKILQAKKEMAQAKKAGAYTEIKEAINKYFDTVLTREELTSFLNDEQFIMPMSSSGAKVGRRKITEDDLLFARKYKNEGGDREMTLKLDADSKYPVAASGAYKELKKLSKYEFRELKESFKPKFFKFAETEEGKKWIGTFFPHIQADLEEHLKSA